MTDSLSEIARRLLRLERAQQRATTPQLANSSIEDGAVESYADDSLGLIVGAQFDGTQAVAVVNGPVPPTPSTPLLTAVLGGARIRWDGLFADADFAPMDFSRVEVHASTDPAFTAEFADTLVATFETPRGGEVFISLPSGVNHVKFVARSLAGNRSPASVAASVTPEEIKPDPPAESPVPQPITGPAAIVMNFTPPDGEGATVDLYFNAVGPTEPIDATTLHTENFPPGGFIYTDQGGQAIPPETTVWVALWARNNGGAAPAPSAWVEATAGSIQPEYLSLLAGSIIAQRLQGETVQAVNLTGVTLDILDALYAEPGYLEVIANLVEAQSAIFYDNVTRRGTNNYLEGRETASAGVTNPGVPPTVTATWPYIETSMGHATGIVRSNNRWVMVGSDTGIHAVSDSGHFAGTLYEGSFLDQCEGITRIGDYYYTLELDFMADSWVIRRYSALTANEGEGPLRELTLIRDEHVHPGSLTIGTDGTDILIAYINNSGEWRYRKQAVGLASLTNPWVTLGGASGKRKLVGIAGSTMIGDGLTIYPENQSARRWSESVMEPGSMMYQGAEQALPFGRAIVAAFDKYTLDADGRLYTHSTLYDGTQHAWTYTWTDDDPAGAGTAESLPSPARTTKLPWGAYHLVKTPLPPDDGSVDAPNTVQIYADDTTQGGSYSAAELTSGRTFMYVTTGGNPPPLESGFASRASQQIGGYEASVGDANGPLWYMRGDGSWRTGPISGDANGNVVSNRAACRMEKTGQQSFANNTQELVTLGTIITDTRGDMADVANNRIVIREAGDYVIEGQIRFAANATGDRWIALRRNGSIIAGSSGKGIGNATGNFAAFNVTLFGMNVDDVFDIVALQNSGAALSTSSSATSTFLSARRI